MDIDKIYCEDCIAGMERIPDGAVDMILCDPPFGTTSNFWDKRLPMEEMWRQFKRVTQHNAAIVLFSQLPFAVDLINANRKMFRYEWIWHKTNAVGFLNANKMPLRAHENILVFYRKLPTYNPQYTWGTPYTAEQKGRGWGKQIIGGNYSSRTIRMAKDSDGRRYPLDVVKFTGPQIATEHSTRKPTDLCEYLIKTYTNAGELVLDACMGSGTTAVAAINTGRHFIGFENHQPFVDICNRRIEEAKEKWRQRQGSETQRAVDATTDINAVHTRAQERVTRAARPSSSTVKPRSVAAIRDFATAPMQALFTVRAVQ